MQEKFFDNIWHIKHIRNGKVIWQQVKHNDLTNAGQRNILNTYLCNIEEPSSFYIRLCRNFIGKTDTIASIAGEPSGNGYTPQEVERSIVGFPEIELVGADYRRVSKTVTFVASGGNIGPVNYMILTTSSDASGILIAGLGLENERTILDGIDSLEVSFKVKLR
jgi:hypothetical protein